MLNSLFKNTFVFCVNTRQQSASNHPDIIVTERLNRVRLTLGSKKTINGSRLTLELFSTLLLHLSDHQLSRKTRDTLVHTVRMTHA